MTLLLFTGILSARDPSWPSKERSESCFFNDLADSINLERLKSILRLPPTQRLPSFTHPTPEYVRFESPPVVERLPALELEKGERLEARIKYFDNGVASLEMELPFACEWDALVSLSTEWIAALDIEKRALEVVRSSLQRVAGALVKPQGNLSTEDYYIIELSDARFRGEACDSR